MRILEILLPKGASDRSLSPQVVRKIDALQTRMDSYVDKIMNPNTSSAGKEFLKSRLRDDYYELRDLIPKTHAVAEGWQKSTLTDTNRVKSPKNPKGGYRTCDKCGKTFSRLGITKHRCIPKDVKESIDTAPVDYKWVHTGKDEAIAYFTVGEIDYIFTAKSNSIEEWIIRFDANTENGSGDTGTGNAPQVFSTVVAIIRDFASKYDGNIKRITFFASNSKRTSIYRRIFKVPGYNTKEVNNGDSTTFVLTPEKKQNKFQKFVSSKLSEAVTKLPLSNDDFELVKKVMERPIYAAIAPIYIHQIIEDDELNDQLASLEESDPGMDVRPLIAEWFNRVMPDQMCRFTDDNPTPAQKNGVLSVIHGYDSKDYKGTNDPMTGDAYGFR